MKNVLATTLASPSDSHSSPVSKRRSPQTNASVFGRCLFKYGVPGNISADLPAHAYRRLSIQCDRRLQHGASAYGRSIISTLVCGPVNVYQRFRTYFPDCGRMTRLSSCKASSSTLRSPRTLRATRDSSCLSPRLDRAMWPLQPNPIAITEILRLVSENPC